MSSSAAFVLIAVIGIGVILFCKKKSRTTALESTDDSKDYAASILEHAKDNPDHLPYN